MLAWEPITVAVPISLPLSVKVTVPVSEPVPVPVTSIEAVSVTGWLLGTDAKDRGLEPMLGLNITVVVGDVGDVGEVGGGGGAVVDTETDVLER
jgi:hypothetical protein